MAFENHPRRFDRNDPAGQDAFEDSSRFLHRSEYSKGLRRRSRPAFRGLRQSAAPRRGRMLKSPVVLVPRRRKFRFRPVRRHRPAFRKTAIGDRVRATPRVIDPSPRMLPTNSFAKEMIPVSLEEEMRRSYLDYAMSVIVGRALPDLRDGLEARPPARAVRHERTRATTRTARTRSRRGSSGDVMGKYHPHGDSRSTTRWSAWRSRSRCAIR